jgi:hypothetical protein
MNRLAHYALNGAAVARARMVSADHVETALVGGVVMDAINAVYRTGPKLEIRLPANASPEAVFLLADVLEQMMSQLFDHFDHEIASEVMRLYAMPPESPDQLELDFSDLPNVADLGHGHDRGARS